MDHLTRASQKDERNRLDEVTPSTVNPENERSGVEADSLPTSVIFYLLSSDRRREVLICLARSDGETTLGEMAEVVAGKKLGIDPGDLTNQQR